MLTSKYRTSDVWCLRSNVISDLCSRTFDWGEGKLL